MNNKLLYIGLNGLAGSGKDSVAKMINIILSKNWTDINECWEYYNNYYKGITVSATFNKKAKPEEDSVLCIAFADQLKYICSSIFGIPVERFYNNKSNAWICINDDFHYTEIRPENIITAEEYYYNCSEYKNSDTKYYLSLRDILVYTGTYVLQQDVNKNVFINIVQNKITEISLINSNLKYVIVTDIRFIQELEYLYKHNGITIKIVKPDVMALDNIAEHDLDDEDGYTFTIDNNGSYEELFVKVWKLVKENVVFKNIYKQLSTRDNIDNYIRKISETEYAEEWQICSPYGINRIGHESGEITFIELVGGPTIVVNEEIPVLDIIPQKIVMDENNNSFNIIIDKSYSIKKDED